MTHSSFIFYSLINKFPVHGAAVGIVLADYNSLLPRLRQIRPTKKYTASPYFIAFELCIAQLAAVARRFPPREKIAFIFDQQKEFQGRAKELYDLALQNYDEESLGYYHRLGSLAFSSRCDDVAIQTADVLAYESYRYLYDYRLQGKPVRWQMKILQERPIEGKLLHKTGLEELCGLCGA